MKTEIWGSTFWKMLHLLSFSYPEKPSHIDKHHFIVFLHSVSNVLPCNVCRMHMKYYLQSITNWDDTIHSRKKCIEFMWKFHNYVNKRIGKVELKYVDFISLYNTIIINPPSSSLYHNVSNKIHTSMHYFTILTIFIVLSYIIISL